MALRSVEACGEGQVILPGNAIEFISYCISLFACDNYCHHRHTSDITLSKKQTQTVMVHIDHRVTQYESSIPLLPQHVAPQIYCTHL